MESKVQARKVVLISMFLLFAISLYRDRKAETQGDTFRRLWAVGVVGLLLSLLADFAPSVAGPFAGLTVLGWFVKDGTQLIDNAIGKGTPAAVGSASTTRK